jgi:hypothetical protein
MRSRLGYTNPSVLICARRHKQRVKTLEMNFSPRASPGYLMDRHSRELEKDRKAMVPQEFSAHRDGSVGEVAHVSKHGLTTTDAQDHTSQRQPGCTSSVLEVLEGIVGRDSLENIRHVPATTLMSRFCV